MRVWMFAVLMLLAGLIVVAIDTGKSDVQNKQDNATVYYRKAYSLWEALLANGMKLLPM
ncbi:hypothetical protein LR003_03965 [candidate division NPL-UPA2 bacterium]|nr:hypothetical protein [candidate division NPL-UPA2 bacterium]